MIDVSYLFEIATTCSLGSLNGDFIVPIHITATVILGALMLVVGHVWLVVAAFRTTIVWGLVTLFIPFWGSLVYIAMHWRRSAKPFFVYLGGFACIGCSVLFVMALPPEQLKALTDSSDEKQSVVDEESVTDKQPVTDKKPVTSKRHHHH